MSKRLHGMHSETLVLGALTHKLEWLDTKNTKLDQGDFVTKQNQIIYSILRDRHLEGASEITAEQLFLACKQHPVANDINMEYITQLRVNIGSNVVIGTYIKEVGRLNKLKTLRKLEKEGFDLTELIGEDSVLGSTINAVIDDLKIEQILNFFRTKVDGVEATVMQGGALNLGTTAGEGIEELFEMLRTQPLVGSTLDGQYYNSIVSGALFGKLYINSSPTGVGKSRDMIGQAAYLAYPRIHDNNIIEHKRGGYESVLFITTELTEHEVRLALLATISGVEEHKIKHSSMDFTEQLRVKLAADIIHQQDHFHIIQIPTPSTAAIKSTIERFIRKYKTNYIFFDYIYNSPALKAEYKSGERSDEVLLYLSTALKDIASINDVFIKSATQVNGSLADAEVRDENSLRGAKSIADKIDVGSITVDIRSSELDIIQPLVEELGCRVPNVVTDIYKNRGGRYNGVKIFRYFDKGTCRMEDLFVTTRTYDLVDIAHVYTDETSALINEDEFRKEYFTNEPNTDKE